MEVVVEFRRNPDVSVGACSSMNLAPTGRRSLILLFRNDHAVGGDVDRYAVAFAIAAAKLVTTGGRTEDAAKFYISSLCFDRVAHLDRHFAHGDCRQRRRRI